MAWNRKDMGDLRGRVAVVTGPNSGLGLESARALGAAGARVLLACRGQARARDALASVGDEATGADPEVTARPRRPRPRRSTADDVAVRVERLVRRPRAG